jgi:gamma-glutamyltranspeptidase
MVIYLAKTHQVVTIDGRETCPSACTPTMFTDPKTGQPLGYDCASDQPLATGVPSMVATWAKAVSLYGRKSLAAALPAGTPRSAAATETMSLLPLYKRLHKGYASGRHRG